MANILVVDDEEDMLETIAYNLERAGTRWRVRRAVPPRWRGSRSRRRT